MMYHDEWNLRASVIVGSNRLPIEIKHPMGARPGLRAKAFFVDGRVHNRDIKMRSG
jgi:hypothetical protein